MKKTWTKGKNALFTIVVAVSIVFLVTFIIMAVSLVLVRGIPGIGTSLANPEIRFAIRMSFVTSFISTVLCIIVALPVAYGITRFRFRGRRLLGTVIDIPMALPPIVSGVALLLLFGTTYLGQAMAAHGLEFVFTPLGIVAAQFFVNVPYMTKVLESAIEDVDPRLEFVARTLGCSRWQCFFRVTLPLVQNGLIAGVVITWARALGEFGAVLMLASATRMKTETLPVSLFLHMSCGEIEPALAVASILIAISVLSLFLFEIMGGNRFEVSRGGH